MLEIKSVTKTYKKQTVFRDLSKQYDRGVTILTGPSGVGKSTLLRLCASVEKPSHGEVLWNGQNIQKSKGRFRKILGYAPQIIDFPEDLTAADFMLHIGALKGLSAKTALAQSKDLLEKLGLINDLHKSIGNFSGGMRRRLGLAQAFLGTPECLVIDEPTAELDNHTADKVHRLIFSSAKHATIIMTTHLEQSLSGYNFQKHEMIGA